MTDKQLTHEEILEIATQREKENEEQQNPDEIVVENVKMVHFEMMDDGLLWCGIYHQNGQVDHFNIFANGDKIGTLWSPNCG
jgi:hypothetical protein